MKLYEFVDKLYEMGDMESPKTVRSKKTLNESVSSREDDLDEDLKEAIYDRSFDASDKAFLRKNGYRKIEKDCYRRDFDDLGISFVIYRTPQTRQLGLGAALPGDERWTSFRQGVYSSVYDVFQTIEYIISHQDRLQNILDDLENLNEGILGGLAGAALGGAIGNGLGHPILGSIGGGLAGSAIQNALNDDLDEALDDIVSVDVDFNIDDGEDFDEIKNYLKDKFNIDVVRYDPDGLYDNITLQGSKENLVKYLSTDYGGYDEDDPDIGWVEEFFPELFEDLNEDKDLSTVKRSMTRVLQDNREKIDNCSTPQEVRDVVAGLLAEANMDTPATRKLLMNLDKSRSLTNSLQTVYNSILKGSGLGVC